MILIHVSTWFSLRCEADGDSRCILSRYCWRSGGITFGHLVCLSASLRLPLTLAVWVVAVAFGVLGYEMYGYAPSEHSLTKKEQY